MEKRMVAPALPMTQVKRHEQLCHGDIIQDQTGAICICRLQGSYILPHPILLTKTIAFISSEADNQLLERLVREGITVNVINQHSFALYLKRILQNRSANIVSKRSSASG
jgi:hypothetical protein